MANRSQWLRNKAQHDQREFGYVEPVKVDADEATIWIPEFTSSLEHIASGTKLTLKSMIVLQLGATPQERELKMRELSRRGIVSMHAERDDAGNFVQFFWTVR